MKQRKPEAEAATATIADSVRTHMSNLRPAERKVARVLLSDYPSAGLSTVADLAQRADVSGPTVVRFAHSMGFDGFAALQTQLRAELTLSSASPLLRAKPVQSGTASHLLISRATEISRLALESLAAIPPADLESAIALLADTSRRVFLLGGRFTGRVAESLAAHLEQIRPKVRYLPDPLGADLGQLLDAGRRDVWVLMDVTRYQRSVVDVAEAIRRRGATIILVTDEQLSPLVSLADVVLPATVASPSPFYSLTAPWMLAELLVVAVFERLGEFAQARLAVWENGRAHELVNP